MPETIRILVVDDHLVVRHGVAQLLSAAPDVTIVGEAENGEEALLLCQKLCPDIVLMDIRMPGMGGLAAAEAIRRFHPKARVIGLSTFAEDHTVAAMLATGAHGHLPKSVTFDELVGAIRKVHAGGTAVQSEPSGRTAGANAGAPRGPPTITGQQRRVLALMAKGFTNAEIAKYLGFSASTANYHVGAILAKLGVSNRAEAAAMAIREHLVDERDL
ncbi:MAG: response regulator transcription factor [Sphingomonas sp.]